MKLKLKCTLQKSSVVSLTTIADVLETTGGIIRDRALSGSSDVRITRHGTTKRVCVCIRRATVRIFYLIHLWSLGKS